MVASYSERVRAFIETQRPPDQLIARSKVIKIARKHDWEVTKDAFSVIGDLCGKGDEHEKWTIKFPLHITWRLDSNTSGERAMWLPYIKAKDEGQPLVMQNPLGIIGRELPLPEAVIITFEEPVLSFPLSPWIAPNPDVLFLESEVMFFSEAKERWEPHRASIEEIFRKASEGN